MERAGLVSSRMAESPAGPKRKQYILTKSVSMVVDFAPHLYKARIFSFDTPHDSGSSPATSSLVGRIDETAGSSDEPRKINAFAKILEEIDRRINSLEDERAVLLYIRNLAMKEASRTIDKAEKRTDRKRVLHYILDQHNRDVDSISRTLNIREADVRKIVTDLKKLV
jgi:predicted transcriptional regulator